MEQGGLQGRVLVLEERGGVSAGHGLLMARRLPPPLHSHTFPPPVPTFSSKM